MSRGLGGNEKAVLRALLERRDVTNPGMWYPLYTPARLFVVVSREGGQFAKRGLPEMDKIIAESENLMSPKSSIRRAAQSLSRKGFLETLVCGASYLVFEDSDEMMSHPLLCVRFSDRSQSLRAKAELNRLDNEQANRERRSDFRERVRSILLEQSRIEKETPRPMEDDEDAAEYWRNYRKKEKTEESIKQ